MGPKPCKERSAPALVFPSNFNVPTSLAGKGPAKRISSFADVAFATPPDVAAEVVSSPFCGLIMQC